MISGWIENFSEFKGIQNEWDNLVYQSKCDNPFLWYDFISTWYEIYHDSCELRIFYVKEGEKIIAGIPLCLERTNINENYSKKLFYCGKISANLTEGMALPNMPFSFAQELVNSLGKRKDWDILSLGTIRQESTFGQEIENLVVPNYLKYKISKNAWNAKILLPKSPDAFIEKLPRKLRRNLRYYKRKANDHGGISLLRISGVQNVENLFKLFVDFSKKSYLYRNRKSAFCDPKKIVFFRTLLIKLEQKRRLDSYVLKIADNITAILFGYRLGEGFKAILICFNPKWTHLDPGHLMWEQIITRCINQGEPYFNMYGITEKDGKTYKHQWCKNFEQLLHFKLVNNTLLGRTYALTHWSPVSQCLRKFYNFLIPTEK